MLPPSWGREAGHWCVGCFIVITRRWILHIKYTKKYRYLDICARNVCKASDIPSVTMQISQSPVIWPNDMLPCIPKSFLPQNWGRALDFRDSIVNLIPWPQATSSIWSSAIDCLFGKAAISRRESVRRCHQIRHQYLCLSKSIAHYAFFTGPIVDPCPVGLSLQSSPSHLLCCTVIARWPRRY